MAKFKDSMKARLEDTKTKVTKVKVKHAAKKKANRSVTQIQKEEEKRLWEKLETLVPGSKEYAEVTKMITEVSKVHAEKRVSADNLCAAITSVTGVGGAIAYDQKHNFPKLATPFIGKPGKVPRVKPE